MVGTRPARIRQDATVGRILRHARQRRGETVAAVAEALYIPVKHLQALERGDLSVFAAEVYARGAFSAYADYLGVRAEATRRAFWRQLSRAREEVPLKVHTPRPWLLAVLTPQWLVAAVITAVALAVGGYIVWQVEQFLRLPPLMLSPLLGVVEQDELAVAGQAPEASVVTVNEDPVLVAADGSFAVAVALRPGINVVQVVATNAAGRQRVVTHHVLRPRTAP